MPAFRGDKEVVWAIHGGKPVYRARLLREDGTLSNEATIVHAPRNIRQSASSVTSWTTGTGQVTWVWDAPAGPLRPTGYDVTTSFGPDTRVAAASYTYEGSMPRIKGLFGVRAVYRYGVGPWFVANVVPTWDSALIHPVDNIRPPTPSMVDGGYAFVSASAVESGGTALEDPTWSDISGLPVYPDYYFAVGFNLTDADGVDRSVDHAAIPTEFTDFRGARLSWWRSPTEFIHLAEDWRIAGSRLSGDGRRCVVLWRQINWGRQVSAMVTSSPSTVDMTSTTAGPRDGRAHLIFSW